MTLPTAAAATESGAVSNPRCRKRATFANPGMALYATSCSGPGDGGRGPRFNPCERTAMALYRPGHGMGVRSTAALFRLFEVVGVQTNQGLLEKGVRCSPGSLIEVPNAQ